MSTLKVACGDHVSIMKPCGGDISNNILDSGVGGARAPGHTRGEAQHQQGDHPP